MSVLRLFDPSMCGSPGVCGPAVDPALARLGGDLEGLRGQGVEVRRFNLARQPGAFVEHVAPRLAVEPFALGTLTHASTGVSKQQAFLSEVTSQ